MFTFRQSKVKPHPNPEVINVESYGQKKAPCKTAQHRKQPWINNGIIKLSIADRAIIKRPTGWLTGDIINTAQATLQEQFRVPGFQPTEYGQCCSFNVELEEFIQTVHIGSNHWLTISTIGTKHPEVYVYNCLVLKSGHADKWQ